MALTYFCLDTSMEFNYGAIVVQEQPNRGLLCRVLLQYLLLQNFYYSECSITNGVLILPSEDNLLGSNNVIFCNMIAFSLFANFKKNVLHNISIQTEFRVEILVLNFNKAMLVKVAL